MTMGIGLLGEVVAHAGERPVDLGPAMQRRVLAVLAVDLGRVVSADQLIDRVWGAQPPPRARASLTSYASRLRHALADVGAGIVRKPGGYLLAAEPAAVDLHRFRTLCAQARGCAEDAARVTKLLTEALELWRGEALVGLSGDWAATERARLHQERLTAECDLADARLQLGHAAELVAELSTRAGEHPLNERVAGQYMRALHRSGRAADALEHYRLVRARLVEELGADPGEALQQLHQEILSVQTPRGVSPVPQQLPADAAGFTGRIEHLAELDALEPGVVPLIVGTGGVGKTALAVHWAHRVKHLFPDGQLHADLRGYGQETPADPADVLARFLRALGVEGLDIPHDPAERATRLRSALADKRVLILLDNARSADQVRPLLPGTRQCLAIVTSRDALSGLVVANGGHRLSLDRLTVPESRTLLRKLIGPRAETPAADRLIEQCARLPLALRVAADLAARRPHAPLADLVAELTDEQRRLDQLDAGGDTRTAVRTVFSWSYHALGSPAARLFQLLGLVPGPDISADACAALLASPVGTARSLLDELAMAHLVEEHRAGRFKLHDLLRVYAREFSLDHSLRGLLEHYLHTAYRAERLMAPTHPEPAIPFTVSPSTRGFPDQVAALDWFAIEHENLLALQAYAHSRGWYAEVVQLAHATRSGLYRKSLWAESLRVQNLALSSAETLGNLAAQVECHGVLATVHVRLGDYEKAVSHGHQGVALAADLGDPVRSARAHRGVAWTHSFHEAYRAALPHCHEALRLLSGGADPALEADLLNGAGWNHAKLGEYEVALGYCTRAAALAKSAGDLEAEAPTLDSIGFIQHQLGNHAAAIENYLAAAAMFEQLGIRVGQVDAHHHIGDVHRSAGNTTAALASWRTALAVLNDPSDAQHDVIEAKIAAIPNP